MVNNRLVSTGIWHEKDEFNTIDGPPCPNCKNPMEKSLRHWVCYRYFGCLSVHRRVTKEECKTYGFPYYEHDYECRVLKPFFGCEHLYEFSYERSKTIHYACELGIAQGYKDYIAPCECCERVIKHRKRKEEEYNQFIDSIEII